MEICDFRVENMLRLIMENMRSKKSSHRCRWEPKE